MTLKKVAIVGRPNVGKSTLFNKLVGFRHAIVEDRPGVTRDRHFIDTEILGRPVTFVDTGGFVPDKDIKDLSIQNLIRAQAELAVREAELIIFVVDGRDGLTPADQEVARALRKSNRPTIVVVNKIDDSKRGEELLAGFHRLGLGEPMGISAEHSLGLHDLEDAIAKFLPEPPPEVPKGERKKKNWQVDPIRLAIVGRPNVGKSSLVNALLGEERVIVSDIAGTTRDPIDTAFTRGTQDFIITDTAGIRRKAVITERVESYSVSAAIKVLETCDIAVLLLDATEPAVDQDARIAGIVEELGRPLLIVVNKWDLKRGVEKEDAFRDEVKLQLRWAAWAPIIFISAKQGDRVGRVLDLAIELHTQAHHRASTPLLNRLLKHVTEEHPLPMIGGKTLKIYYVAQIAEGPPTFQFICNKPELVADHYKRYLLNQLRDTFGLKVPVRLKFKERPGGKARKAALGRYRAAKRGQKPGRLHKGE